MYQKDQDLKDNIFQQTKKELLIITSWEEKENDRKKEDTRNS
jgi:hypothetical protein